MGTWLLATTLLKLDGSHLCPPSLSGFIIRPESSTISEDVAPLPNQGPPVTTSGRPIRVRSSCLFWQFSTTLKDRIHVAHYYSWWPVGDYDASWLRVTDTTWQRSSLLFEAYWFSVQSYVPVEKANSLQHCLYSVSATIISMSQFVSVWFCTRQR